MHMRSRKFGEGLHGPIVNRDCDVETKMDACTAVEKEVDKVLNKFSDANENAGSSLDDILQYINRIREELIDGVFVLFLGV